ncbi:DDE-type integrase/transposase/recombinase [Methanoregula sp.]|uniref:DDE-type integrase/transposase/recombinase n=1 Tax=Methanoregula sp. TaxID=2052170 RepID=UPI002CA02FFF|nr:DDE-type integrase/transposase/recombinase [Methanoregula sp.]HVP96397.1 DDE-type integrase/transposase/recombinase [Methanoregula sp.]
MQQLTTTRQERGEAIAKKVGQIRRLDETHYIVKSQSRNDQLYEVSQTDIGWNCSCPDHQTRGVECKHIIAVKLSFAMRKQVKASVILDPVVVTNCPACGSEQIQKAGVRHNRSGDIQRYLCEACGKLFSINIGFERMKHNPKAITAAMQLYFSGESLRNTQRSLKLLGAEVSHQTISNWIAKYTELMKGYVDKLNPQVGDVWRADEVYIKVKGNMKYLFALMDDETRYWIAQEVADSKHKHDAQGLFHEGKQLMDKVPSILITDGLPAYHDAFKREFYSRMLPQPRHINAIKITGHQNEANNNKMERINGEIRDREKTMRGLKKKNTPILKGMQVYHNYIKPHEGLDGKTPAEACGIQVNGENKWMTLIQNAASAQIK